MAMVSVSRYSLEKIQHKDLLRSAIVLSNISQLFCRGAKGDGMDSPQSFIHWITYQIQNLDSTS